MAKCEMKLPESFLLKCSRLGDKTDSILARMLEAGGAVVLAKVRSNLRAVIGKDTKLPSQSTGELLASLGLSPAKVSRSGIHNIKVGFNEPRRRQYARKGKRSYYTATNAMVANVLEHGRPGQPAKPFLKPAKSSSRKPCIEAMQAKLDEEMNNL
ncbi:MAG: HK97 gp10 family phage protein [Betaproteobacteria bacterium]|nr:HK97 gp10 family phage protein [Betaproteobacteria bacterium]